MTIKAVFFLLLFEYLCMACDLINQFDALADLIFSLVNCCSLSYSRHLVLVGVNFRSYLVAHYCY